MSRHTIIDSAAIGRRIREARQLAGISQGDLAKALGMRQGPVCNIEKGRNAPSAAVLAQICRVIEVRADYLLLGTREVSSGHAHAEIARLRVQISEITRQRDALRGQVAAMARQRDALHTKIREVLDAHKKI